jgi:hypothetical protein
VGSVATQTRVRIAVTLQMRLSSKATMMGRPLGGRHEITG